LLAKQGTDGLISFAMGLALQAITKMEEIAPNAIPIAPHAMEAQNITVSVALQENTG